MQGTFKEVEMKKQKAPAPTGTGHQKELPRLRRMRGQIDGIEKMINDRRYCPDILIQIKAATAALRTIELSILERHLEHCLAQAIREGNTGDAKKKIDEIVLMLSRKGF